MDALVRLLGGVAENETPASAAQRQAAIAEKRPIAEGFVEGSEAWTLAELLEVPMLGWEPVDMGDTLDMFAEPLPTRYTLDLDDFWDRFPMAFGGDEPADPYRPDDPQDYGEAMAWDEGTIMFYCPRGLCRIYRAEWEAGYRACRGC